MRLAAVALMLTAPRKTKYWYGWGLCHCLSAGYQVSHAVHGKAPTGGNQGGGAVIRD